MQSKVKEIPIVSLTRRSLLLNQTQCLRFLKEKRMMGSKFSFYYILLSFLIKCKWSFNLNLGGFRLFKYLIPSWYCGKLRYRCTRVFPKYKCMFHVTGRHNLFLDESMYTQIPPLIDYEQVRSYWEKNWINEWAIISTAWWLNRSD